MSRFLSELEDNIPSLRRYAFSLLKHQQEADDLVQDCLERALRKRLLFRRGASTRAWLFSILHNLYVNKARRGAAKPETVSLEQDSAFHHDPSDTDCLMADIESCLDKLSDEHKQVLLLVALEGMSYKEVGKILGIPVGTVMSRLARARDKLHILMSGQPTPVLKRVK